MNDLHVAEQTVVLYLSFSSVQSVVQEIGRILPIILSILQIVHESWQDDVSPGILEILKRAPPFITLSISDIPEQ